MDAVRSGDCILNLARRKSFSFWFALTKDDTGNDIFKNHLHIREDKRF